VRDIANFLDYAAEPIKAKRQSMGIFVMLYLLVFFAFAYLLKKEYWKDVH
jgi:cytochrome c1